MSVLGNQRSSLLEVIEIPDDDTAPVQLDKVPRSMVSGSLSAVIKRSAPSASYCDLTQDSGHDILPLSRSPSKRVKTEQPQTSLSRGEQTRDDRANLKLAVSSNLPSVGHDTVVARNLSPISYNPQHAVSQHYGAMPYNAAPYLTPEYYKHMSQYAIQPHGWQHLTYPHPAYSPPTFPRPKPICYGQTTEGLYPATQTQQSDPALQRTQTNWQKAYPSYTPVDMIRHNPPIIKHEQGAAASPTPIASPAAKDTAPAGVKDDPQPRLCKEQRQLVDIIVQGHNVFYTGSAGCGKSTVLKAFVKKLTKLGKEVKIIAPTGRAALDINGSTFWTFAGWTPNSMKQPIANLEKDAWRTHVHKRLTKTDVLVVDEVSMVENHHFERLNRILKIARKNDLPFGGIQMVVTGDFCQLPPVKPFQFCMFCGKETIKSRDGREYKCRQHGVFYDTDKWAFASNAWAECKFQSCHLRKIHRQNDKVFIELLQKLRMGGRLDPADRSLLLNHPSETTNAVRLFPTVAEVKRTNDAELAKLHTHPRVYNCLDTFHWQEAQHPGLHMKNKRNPLNNSLEALRESRLEVRTELKVGMLVVLLVNLDIENGLVNGSQGKVVRFERYAKDSGPVSIATLKDRQKAKSSSDVIVPPGIQALTGEYAEIREQQINAFVSGMKIREWPVVQFTNGREVTVYADCRPNALGDEEPFSLLMRTQIPLVCGWAMTVHKSQGMTLSRVQIDLQKVFETGMAYVALSRARDLMGLKVDNLGEELPGNEQVKDFLINVCKFKM